MTNNEHTYIDLYIDLRVRHSILNGLGKPLGDLARRIVKARAALSPRQAELLDKRLTEAGIE